MKVVTILGSPRKNGTSARIAKAFTEKMQENGAEVENFYLNALSYKGCQACERCHTKLDHCVLEDELTPALDAMRTADVTVFSSPIYFGDVSGQFKQFFDRTWSHVHVDYTSDSPFTSRIPKGKTALFILSQGDVEGKHAEIAERYQSILGLYGYDLKIIRATGLMSGRPDEDVSSFQAEAIKIAEGLMGA
ncbi:MAG: flavodoxin family protein [Desulfovibrio sp.]|uniref:flavodoxin family protein n=1 Tax=Desulfovibrio sp. 7SRBS1 TaxID=3378064 RepID=UPI003B4229A4